ncbi:MAG: cyclic nucleotide-binding domain-containing protein [bacterium]|nr:cyclic nucleotide-binding domain-containing protein [bacterium]
MRKVLFILSELADEDVEWFVHNGNKEKHTQGTVLINEGKPIDVLYILIEGQLSVSLAALGGKEIARLLSGEILGELSFLDSRPPSATVSALTDATVLSVPRSALGDKLENDPPFAARFYRALGVFLASRLRKTQQRLGYGKDDVLDDDVQHEDELDPSVLGQVALAGARFDWMMKRLRGEPSAGSSR